MRLSSLLALIGRLLLGGVFLWSSIPKIAHPDRFLSHILEYGLIGPGSAEVVAAILPWLELALALALLSGFAAAGAFALAAFLLTIFTGLHGWVITQGMEVACGCFGGSTSQDLIGPWTLTRNLLLLTVGIIGVWTTTTRWPRKMKRLPSQPGSQPTDTLSQKG